MKKIFNYVWVLAIPLCCGVSCFVDNEAETDLVLSFGIDETFNFDVEGAFDESRLITRAEVISDVDIPEDAQVKRVDIEYIAAEVVPLSGNEATNGVTINAYYGDDPFFTDKDIGFNSGLEVVTGLNANTVIALRNQLLNYFDNDGSNNEDIVIRVSGNTNPPGQNLKVRVMVRLQGSVTFATDLL